MQMNCLESDTQKISVAPAAKQTTTLADLRFGCVSYLNSRPFLAALDGIDVACGPPSQLAEKLRKGDLDCALIPIWECLAHPGYRLIDGLCIGCHGSVYSVILTHTRPLRELQTIALDLHSQTSVRLLQVLCRKHFKIDPLFVDEHTASEAPSAVTGRLLIGDRAIQERERGELKENEKSDENDRHDTVRIIDLGEAWCDYTGGLGFIFAVWAIHPKSAMNAEQIKTFRRLLLENVEDQALHRCAANAFEKRYLTECIRYTIGPEQKEGFQQFSRELAELSLIPGNAPKLDWV